MPEDAQNQTGKGLAHAEAVCAPELLICNLQRDVLAAERHENQGSD